MKRSRSFKGLGVRCALICVMLALIASGSVLGTRAFAEEVSTRSNVTAQCERMTNSDAIETTGNSLQNFLDKLSSGYYTYRETLAGEAWLERCRECDANLRGLIPSALLEQDGQFAYVGNEYSFAIDKWTSLDGTQNANVLFVNNIYILMMKQ